MDGSRPGEAGVLAWCNTIRFNMARDPGRQILHDQIQTQGFDFLESYLESFFEGSQDEPVIELLKTPGRKKNAPARTRSAAAAAAAKSRTITSLSFEDGGTKENGAPVNEFQKALLRAKEKEEGADARLVTASQQPSRKGPVKRSTSFAQLKNQKIVTIADSPATQVPNQDELKMELDEQPRPIPALVFQPGPPSMEPAALDRDEEPLQDAQESVKELSMIAEDDEPAERSRGSLNVAVSHTAAPEAPRVPPKPTGTQDTFPIAPPEPLPSPMETDDATNAPVAPSMDHEAEEPIAGDMTSASANTFHSIPLDSPQVAEREPSSTRMDEYHTAPLPKVSLAPVPVEEDAHSHTAPLPASSSRHKEYTMPLREEPSVPVPGLSRKGSVPQFSGLPAPSPLRKSMRIPGDPTTTSGGGATAPPPGGKRTSWLSKARETKALETTAKRTSTLGQGLGLGVFGSNKRKSGEMLETARDALAGQATSLQSLDEEQRITKVPKLTGSPADFAFDGKGKKKATSPDTVQGTAQHVTSSIEVTIAETSNGVQQDDGDVLDLLKKTAAGFGARVGKSMGKSLGGNAAAALAAARAKAEARVAERHKLEMGLTADSEDVSMTSEDKPASRGPAAPTTDPKESERRLSISDLVPTSDKGKAASPAIRPPAPSEADTSTSTTPPNSPPPASRNTSFVLPSGPVFSKPTAPSGPRVPPVASSAATSARTDVAAAPSNGRDFSSFKLPTNPFSIPAAMTLGVGSKFPPLSAQSSKTSIFSDVVFDHNNVSPQPSWLPSTQDTSYSAGGPQSQGAEAKAVDNDDLDEDDSWGVDEKFAAHQTWTPFGFSGTDPGTNGEQVLKDDTMTWSTLPSRSTSQRGGDTGSIPPTTQSFFSTLPQSKEEEEEEEAAEEADVQEDFAARLAAAAQQPSDADEGVNEADMAMEIDEDVEERGDGEQSDLEEAVLAGKPTVVLVQQTKTDMTSELRSESQQSMASTASSSQQSQLGFFGQASKLVSSVLGGGKKNKPEVKSLQLAAAAAKKQQEELEKKAARLKEMENRRQLAMQRKADEEKARALEEERKIKEEAERRKREREEHTDKRPLRSTTAIPKKAEGDDTKKRKIGGETSQKPPSKDKKDVAPARAMKPPAGPAASTSSKPSALPKSALKQASSSTAPVTPGAAKAASKTVKHVPSSSNLKSAASSKGKTPAREASEPPPAKSIKPAGPAPARGGPPAEPPRVASESIELPDINSEYSDSDDEDRPKRNLPDWAQSPDIAAALQQQSTINPDDIFGRIGPLRMEEIFRTRQSRFRARTSSANWTGTDELTAEEEREYARRMGFR
ncbi:hypothetical protein BV20DRAFT_961307 [Pilatotrama ljubarskyi]|nr:hypothetical protein BV20DRAFT_961307 [Pilatotrama ljubarskyi]